MKCLSNISSQVFEFTSNIINDATELQKQNRIAFCSVKYKKKHILKCPSRSLKIGLKLLKNGLPTNIGIRSSLRPCRTLWIRSCFYRKGSSGKLILAKLCCIGLTNCWKVENSVQNILNIFIRLISMTKIANLKVWWGRINVRTSRTHFETSNFQVGATHP